MPCRFCNASWLSVACAAALLIAMAGARAGVGQEQIANLVVHEQIANLVVHDVPKPLPSIKFEDNAGQARSLADFKGKVVVLNVWATWCVPCRQEMPTLDRLQAALGGSDFAVVPISIDRGGIDAVRKFYADIAVHSLGMYVDTSGQVLRDLGAIGLPTTLIVNRNGQEIGRVIGPAEWDSGAVLQYLKPIVAQHDNNISGSGGTDARVAEKNEHPPSAMQRGLHWFKALFGK